MTPRVSHAAASPLIASASAPGAAALGSRAPGRAQQPRRRPQQLRPARLRPATPAGGAHRGDHRLPALRDRLPRPRPIGGGS